MIQARCNKCGETFEVPGSLAGGTEDCPTCNAAVPIPLVVKRNRSQSPPDVQPLPEPPDVRSATWRQLEFLRRLGYGGDEPRTIDEASWLIDAKKSGRSGEDIERAFSMVKGPHRKHCFEIWKASQIARKTECLETAREFPELLAGVVISEDSDCPLMASYSGAFLPVQVLKRHPDLLPPMKSCSAKICTFSCGYDEYGPEDKVDLDTKMTVGPHLVTTIREHRSNAFGPI